MSHLVDPIHLESISSFHHLYILLPIINVKSAFLQSRPGLTIYTINVGKKEYNYLINKRHDLYGQLGLTQQFRDETTSMLHLLRQPVKITSLLEGEGVKMTSSLEGEGMKMTSLWERGSKKRRRVVDDDDYSAEWEGKGREGTRE